MWYVGTYILVCTYNICVLSIDQTVALISPATPDPVVFGQSINLSCSSFGRPPYNLSWSVGSTVLASADNVPMSGELIYEVTVQSNDNYTEYTCAATNVICSSNTSVTLTRASELTELHFHHYEQ